MKKISLYKSGVHKILGLPRRWTLHKPSMTMPVFKKALEHRAKAMAAAAEAEAGGSRDSSRKRKRGNAGDEEEEAPAPAKQLCVDKVDGDAADRIDRIDRQEDGLNESKGCGDEAVATGEIVSMDFEQQQEQQETIAAPEDQQDHSLKQDSEVSPTIEPPIQGRAKRKEELEAKLRSLTTEKHRLVQILKQILTNEEEMKRRMLAAPKISDVPLLPLPIPASIPRPMDLEEGELDYMTTPTRT